MGFYYNVLFRFFCCRNRSETQPTQPPRLTDESTTMEDEAQRRHTLTSVISEMDEGLGSILKSSGSREIQHSRLRTNEFSPTDAPTSISRIPGEAHRLLNNERSRQDAFEDEMKRALKELEVGVVYGSTRVNKSDSRVEKENYDTLLSDYKDSLKLSEKEKTKLNEMDEEIKSMRGEAKRMSLDRFNHTSGSEGQSLIENCHNGDAEPRMFDVECHCSKNQFNNCDNEQQDLSNVPSLVNGEHRNKEKIFSNDKVSSPIETEMSNIHQDEYDSLKHCSLPQGEVDHSNFSSTPGEYSTSLAAQSSTDSRDTQKTSLNDEYSLCQDTEDTLKRPDPFEEVNMSDSTLKEQYDESKFEIESRQKRIDEETALVESIFNLDDLQRPAVEKQKSIDKMEYPEFSDFKAKLSVVNDQTTEFMDKENQKIQELRDHELDAIAPERENKKSFAGSEAMENESTSNPMDDDDEKKFRIDLDEQKKIHDEQLQAARQKRAEMNRKAQEDLKRARQLIREEKGKD